MVNLRLSEQINKTAWVSEKLLKLYVESDLKIIFHGRVGVEEEVEVKNIFTRNLFQVQRQSPSSEMSYSNGYIIRLHLNFLIILIQIPRY